MEQISLTLYIMRIIIVHLHQRTGQTINVSISGCVNPQQLKHSMHSCHSLIAINGQATSMQAAQGAKGNAMSTFSATPGP